MNNGDIPTFSIPKRIEITVRQRILGEESLAIRIVDTKGIDRTAERRDLEEHLNAPNTIVVLCSSFTRCTLNFGAKAIGTGRKGTRCKSTDKGRGSGYAANWRGRGCEGRCGVLGGTVEEGI